MFQQITKSTIILILIVLVFILLLLLPREIQITHHYGMVFTAEFPFNISLYKDRISEFIQCLQAEKGFGVTKTGVPILEEVKTLLGRSLLIILPCFFLSMGLGTLIGTIQFYYRENFFGKIIAFISWLFSSIPDFFLFIALQYLLIKLMRVGLPHFNLYGHENWYSFIIPLLALMLFPLVHIAKFISNSLETEESQEYVRTSYAKGLVHYQVLLHMLRNCFAGLMNQTQVVMLYILTSLPIIEKLSNYRGAGYELLQSILNNEDMRALAYMIPFLFIMFITILLSSILKSLRLPRLGGDQQ